MQRIERYGVIALVFLLVTIVAVSLWGEQRKAGGLFDFLKRESKSAKIDRLLADAGTDPLPASSEATTRDVYERGLPLSPEPQDVAVPSAHAGPTPSDLFAEPELDEPAVTPEPVPGVNELPRQPPPEPATTRPVAPPPQPPPATRPAPSGPRRHTVRPGETLSEIAQQELGSTRYVDAIVAANQGLHPDRIQAGQVLTLPAIDAAAAPATSRPATASTPPAATPSTATTTSPRTRRYTVKAGETLSEIAMHELGSTHRMAAIEALNAGLRRDHLMAGQVLLLPVVEEVSAAPRVAAAERPVVAQRRSKVQ